MESIRSSPASPLLWHDALRHLLSFLETGAPVCLDDRSLGAAEFEMLQMAGFGPLLSESLAGHPSFPALFGEEVLNGRRVEAHRRALLELLKLLEGKISPPVLFKGMAACDELYTKPSLRMFTDIDVLIAAEDLPAWDDAIRSLGGECTDLKQFPGRGYSARHYFEHNYRLPTDDAELTVELDLHHSFGPRECYPVDYHEVAATSRPSEQGPFLVLNPRQWICALAIHQARTLFVWSYQDYLDLFQILRQGGIEGDSLTETAGRFGSLKACSILLRNLRMAMPLDSRVEVPCLDDYLPAGHEEFAFQLRLPVATRSPGDPSFLRNARRTARLTDSLAGLAHYIVAYVAKRGMDLVVRG